MNPITLTFVLERETKGAVRYQELDPKTLTPHTDMRSGVVGTIYLRKDKIGTPIPRALTLKIEENENAES